MYAYAWIYACENIPLWAYRKLSKKTSMYVSTSDIKKYIGKGIQCQLKAME